MDINALVDRAVSLHQAGDLAQAEALYRDILVTVPGLADIHYLLGMAAFGQGKATAAVKSIRTAVRLKPGVGEWSLNLGIALRQSGESIAALESLEAAAALFATVPFRRADALAESGAVLAGLGRETEAEQALREALALVSHHPSARNNLAAILYNRYAGAGALDRPEAVVALSEASLLAPERIAVWSRLGQAHMKAGRYPQALEAFDAGLARAPTESDLLLGRSDVLSILGRFADAREAALMAAAQSSSMPGPGVALAVAQHGLGLLTDAAGSLRGVLSAHPDNVAALLNLGNVLGDQGDDDGAEACYRHVLTLSPDLAVAHWQRAQARLRAGDLGEGWREYEWRWHMPGFGLSPILRALPVWDGTARPPDGRLLVHAEQGHGDSLQFIRFVPLLRNRGFDIHVQVQPALRRLFRESLGSDIGVGQLGDPVPAGFTCRCPLLGLPLRLGTDNLSSIPADIPYLHVPADRREYWRRRVGTLPGLRVGLVWAGDARADDARAAATDQRRSLALTQLDALGGLPGIHLVSLQKGPKASQQAQSSLSIADWTDELTDFADTAALVSELDLVIGVDTAVIHLSAALGKPTWVLSRFDGCWRWLRARDDNPWYPGLRLFRQTQWGDWRPLIAKLVNALKTLMVERGSEVE
ncbi:MAG: tetratricopeptide repeat protein [Niveispirillum sp.]|uniref:tetratricopeptide repeat protein n=1 Tax=Niveispirillum sp. TaxID=1917217 RepID=UPI003BA68308